jgi:hypothetical protein
MNYNIIEILNNIEDLLKDEEKVSLYRNYKKILSSNKTTIKSINEDILENFDPPSKNIKIYKIVYGIDKKWKPASFSYGPFFIICSQLTITPDLELKQLPDDKSQTITYTINELETIGFKKSHINKIIKAIKNKTISFVPGKKVTITDIINSVSQKRPKRKTSKK